MLTQLQEPSTASVEGGADCYRRKRGCKVVLIEPQMIHGRNGHGDAGLLLIARPSVAGAVAISRDGFSALPENSGGLFRHKWRTGQTSR